MKSPSIICCKRRGNTQRTARSQGVIENCMFVMMHDSTMRASEEAEA